jgi:hypothetical protein
MVPSRDSSLIQSLPNPRAAARSTASLMNLQIHRQQDKVPLLTKRGASVLPAIIGAS